MARTNDPQNPRPPHLQLLEPPVKTRPLPAAVPVLRPDQPVTPAQDALLTGLARRARDGDREARDLLWRAFAPRLEPALRRCGRMTWRTGWARRGGLPWELDDVRQEAWVVFADLVEGWNGDGSFVPYLTAYFPWRLRDAMRRLAPTRRAVPLVLAARIAVDCEGLLDAETNEVLAALAAALSPGDAAVLQMRVAEGAGFADIACRLGVSWRTIMRRWRRVQRVARSLLDDSGNPETG
jgi:RNA polymerase sigma factor (sigma-70 family)